MEFLFKYFQVSFLCNALSCTDLILQFWSSLLLSSWWVSFSWRRFLSGYLEDYLFGQSLHRQTTTLKSICFHTGSHFLSQPRSFDNFMKSGYPIITHLHIIHAHYYHYSQFYVLYLENHSRGKKKNRERYGISVVFLREPWYVGGEGLLCPVLGSKTSYAEKIPLKKIESK